MSSLFPKGKNPGLFLRTFRRHKVGLLATWFIGTVAAIGWIATQVRPTYRAYNVIRSNPGRATVFGLNLDDQTYLDVEKLLATSPKVMTDAAANPKVANLKRFAASRNVARELREAVAVSVIPGTRLIEISVTSLDPAETVTIVNAVAEAYLETNAASQDGMTRQQIRSLEQYLGELKTQMDELERRWKEIVAKEDVDAKPRPRGERAGEPVVVEQSRRVKNDILKVSLELAEAEAVLAAAKSNAKNPPPDDNLRIERIVNQRFAADPEAIALGFEMDEAKEKLAAARNLAKDAEDPAVMKARKKLEEIQDRSKRLYAAKSAIWREEIARGGPNAISPEKEVRDLTAQVERLSARKAALEKNAAELERDNRRQATDAVEIALLLDQRTGLKQMQETVQRRLEQLRYESRGENRISRLSEAVAPARPIRDLRLPLMAIAPFVVLLAVFSFFLATEALFGRAWNSENAPEL